MHNFWVKAVLQQKTVHLPWKTAHPPRKTAHLSWKTVHPPICDGKHYDTDTDWTLYVNTDTDSDSLSSKRNVLWVKFLYFTLVFNTYFCTLDIPFLTCVHVTVYFAASNLNPISQSYPQPYFLCTWRILKLIDQISKMEVLAVNW